MTVEAAAKKLDNEIFLDLQTFNTFKEIKVELEKKLRSIDDFQIGTRVSINMGNKNLTSKQTREIEDILLDYGLHLKAIVNNELSDNNGLNGHMWGDISNYSDTVLLCRHLRSGQKFFNDGNIVVLGDINPGAEIIAGGSILIMGALRGMAHAGAFGDEKTVIAAYRLSPTQLRIANHITRPPDGETIIINNPELARIRAGKVVIEKLKI